MRHILSLLLENQPGSLSRVVGLFSQRGYNIESLTVSPTDDETLSRINITTATDALQLEQIEKNLHKLVDVLKVQEVTEYDYVERELLRMKPKIAIADINNQAIAATFSRTMITSGTTLLTVSALWLLGGAPLEGFSIAMFIGIMTGTWSSIAVGTSLPELLGLRPEHYQVVSVSDTP